MYVGQISYKIFQYFGMWRPSTWDSRWRIWIHRIYFIFMTTLYSSFPFSILIYILQNTGEIVNDMEPFFYFLTYFAVWVKMVSIILRRKTLIESRNMLLSKICQPRDIYESEILQNCSKACRSNTIIFLLMMNIAALWVIMTPPSKRNNFPLPLKMWVPYSLESRFTHFLGYFHQGVAITMSACMTSSVDILATVIMLQICAQLEIIVHRLHSLPRLRRTNVSETIISQHESRIVKDCVYHHICIYLLGKKLNEAFGFVIFVQFFSSMIGMCVVVYQLSKLSLNHPNSWRLIFILLIALMQIFLYCYYGEKMMGKSMAIAEEVYQIDWVETTIRTRRNLIPIMIRTGRPIKLNGSSLIIMTIETFVKIVKSAYSAYNLLKST